MEGITREDARCARVSNQPAPRRHRDQAKAVSTRSLVPVYNDDGSVALDHEEFPRPETTAEGLAGLKASFDVVADLSIQPDGQTFRQAINAKYPDVKFHSVHHAGNDVVAGRRA